MKAHEDDHSRTIRRIFSWQKAHYAWNQKRPFLFFFSVAGLTTSKGIALAFPAYDPHADDFTLDILRLHENNFLDSLQRKWWETKNECDQEQETSKKKGISYFSPGVTHIEIYTY